MAILTPTAALIAATAPVWWHGWDEPSHWYGPQEVRYLVTFLDQHTDGPGARGEHPILLCNLSETLSSGIGLANPDGSCNTPPLTFLPGEGGGGGVLVPGEGSGGGSGGSGGGGTPTPTVIPLPASAPLLATALAALFGFRRKLRHWWNRQPDPQICPRCHLFFDGDGRIMPECPDCALTRLSWEEKNAA